jgi:hypothetical protein
LIHDEWWLLAQQKSSKKKKPLSRSASQPELSQKELKEQLKVSICALYPSPLLFSSLPQPLPRSEGTPEQAKTTSALSLLGRVP